MKKTRTDDPFVRKDHDLIVRKMNLTFLFSFLIFFASWGNSFSQLTKLNLNLKDAPVREALLLIEDQTDFYFIYEDEIFQKGQRVTIRTQNESLDKILDQLAAQTNISYEISDRQIILKSKNPGVFPTVQPKTKDIRGTVRSADGQPIPGATVAIKGSKSGTITDTNGQYQLQRVSDNAILVFSFVGMKPQEVVTLGRNLINIVLEDETFGLEEVVAVGYGKQKKSSIVSSISSITSKQLTLPTRNLSNNLAGQVAGLISIQRSGEPGYDNSEFWIRGISTFAGGTSPLILVDGIPRSMNDIEPDEIETFAILKDAAATAVYGAEGANGVILITSKRGQEKKGTISFRTEHSFSQPTRLPQFVDSWKYLELANEALKNDGLSPVFSDDLISKYRNNEDPDLYPNAQWMDELLADYTTNHRYTMNFRGGTSKTRYFVSGAYYTEDGIFKSDPLKQYQTNIGLERYNLRSNIDIDVSKTTILNVDISGQYVMTNYPGVSSNDIFSLMLNTPSYIFPAVYSDGTLATYPVETDGNNRNPYNQLMNSGYKKEWRTAIQSNVGIQQKLDFLTQGLSFNGKVSFDYNGQFSSARKYNPSRFYATGRGTDGKLIFSQSVSGSPDMGEPEESNTADKKLYVEGSLNYSRSFNDHTLGAMLLYMQKETQFHNQALAYRKQGMVGRATYSYGDRYFVEGNFGYTGSEAFAKGHRFGFFPAVGLGYYISNEKFYPESIRKVVTKLKLRASIGRTGNDNTGSARFLYRPTFKTDAPGFSQGMTSGGGSNSLGGLTEGQFQNLNISWEIEKKQNYGVDLGLFNNKIEIIADYFNSTRTDILLQRRTVPASAGLRQAPWDNFGEVNNQGIDASLDAHHQIGQLKISLRGTFTYARNKILEYDELPQPFPWMATTGTRVNENTLYIAERLYTDDDFIITQNTNGTNSYQLKPELPAVSLQGLLGPGDIKFKDLNEDGMIDTYDKKRGVGNPYNPEISYGFGINLEYKGLYISSFFQGSGNTSVLLGKDNDVFWPFNWQYMKSNYRTFMVDRWTPGNPSQNVMMPRLHSRYANNINKEPNTWFLRNGRFLRFKNFEVGYNIPKGLLQKWDMTTARIYIMGYNLAVWDDIKFWDPETGNNNRGMAYPLPRTITLGLEVTL